MLNIPANDHGALYILELNRPSPDGLEDKTDIAMQAIFGPVLVNTDYVDAIPPGMLADITLPDLIRNGYDMPVSDADAEEMRGMMGTAVLVMSAAFGGQNQTIDLPADVRLVTVLRETPELRAPRPIHTDTADGILTGGKTKKRPSDAAMSGRIATIALIVMFLLVGLMVWIA